MPPPSNSALAAALGVDRRTATRYLARGCPRDIEAAKHWIAMNIRRRGWGAGRKRDAATAAEVQAQRELLADYRRILAECRAVRKIVNGKVPGHRGVS